MTLKTILAAAALTLAPALALAECPWEKQTVNTCPEGQMMDAKTGTCTEQVTG